MSKLDKVFGLTIGIGAAVDQHDRILECGNERSKRRAKNSGNSFNDQRSACKHGTGASCGYKAVGFIVGYKPERFNKGTLFFALNGDCGLIFTCDYVGSVYDFDASSMLCVIRTVFFKLTFYCGFVTGQYDIKIGIMLHCQ